jgi:hypothetical protein
MPSAESPSSWGDFEALFPLGIGRLSEAQRSSHEVGGNVRLGLADFAP